MADFIGLGLTHYPLFTVPDDHMADLLKWTLQDPGIPESEKDVASWPARMREEWGQDAGTAAAAAHRDALGAGLRRCREALDEFAPDIVVVWGDDQYENFREEVVPPFCVLAYGETEVGAFSVMNERGVPNAWGLPDDSTFVLRGAPTQARTLTTRLIEDGFDIAYSYRKREAGHFPHAIGNTQLFLDQDNAGTAFPYPILPITVNCYGQHAISRKGGLARFSEIRDEHLDPVGPSPARCMQLGQAVVRAFRDTDLRVALVASSSWSHAFLNDKDWHLRPDHEADERKYESFTDCDWPAWSRSTGKELVDAGQHEMLNWFCLVGAMAELGSTPVWSEFVRTDVFNSNKCFAVFG